MDGWVKVHRKIENCKALKDTSFDKVHAFIWMIEEANIKSTTMPLVSGRGHRRIKRGCFHTSVPKLSEIFSWSEGKTRRFLTSLESEKMIKTEKDNNGITVEICNYGRYQNAPKKGHADSSAKRHADGSADSSAKPIKNSTITPNEGHADGSANGSAKGHADGTHNKNIGSGAHGAPSEGASGAKEEPDIYGEPIPW